MTINKADLQAELNSLLSVAKARKVKLPKYDLPLTTAAQRLFRTTYRYDPLAFARDCIHWRPGEHLTHYQERILGELPIRKRIAIYGPRGLGKSATLAILVWWGLLTVEDVKLPITAGDWGQLEKYLWPEIHKWGNRLNWTKIGIPVPVPKKQLMNTDITLTQTALTRTASPEDPAKFEGAHASDRIMLIYDEAKVVRPEMFDAGEGSFNGSPGAEGYVLAFSTPSAPIGRFYDICVNRDNRYSDWYVIHISADDMIRAGRMTPEFVAARKLQWGADSALFRNQVQGEFAADAVNTAIPWNYVERAMAYWTTLKDQNQLDHLPLTALACDPAAGGGDLTVIARRGPGNIITAIKEFDYRSTRTTKEQIEVEVNGDKTIPIYLDVIGIGAGIFDFLHGDGYNVLPYNASAAPDSLGTDSTGQVRFLNKRAESWWLVRELLDPDKNNLVAIPDNDFLKGELTAPVWEPAEQGRRKLEAKEKLRKRLGRSTDHADPVIMALLGNSICQPYETEVESTSIAW